MGWKCWIWGVVSLCLIFDVGSEGECYESYIDLYYYHCRMGKFDLVPC